MQGRGGDLVHVRSHESLHTEQVRVQSETNVPIFVLPPQLLKDFLQLTAEFGVDSCSVTEWYREARKWNQVGSH